MRKFYLSVVVCLLAVAYSSAQSAFEKGSNVVNLGVGFGGNLYSGSLYRGSGYSRLPYVSLSFERCIIDNLFDDKSAIGVGGLVGFTSAKMKDYWTSTDIAIGARGAFHYQFVDKLDTYAGVMIGYNINTWKWKGSGSGSTGSSGLTWSTFVGARYYLTDAIGVFAEVGWGYTVLNAGLAFKF